MPFDSLHDSRVRLAAFRWLEQQTLRSGDVLQREVLAAGFDYEGQRVPLVGPQGIFKPALLADVPISITTTSRGPYSDAFGSDGLLKYSYRGSNPEHHENKGLRLAMERRIPLAYFHGIVPGKYLAAWPVYIVADDRQSLSVTVAVDDARQASHQLAAIAQGIADVDHGEDPRRRYITATVKMRLHQRAFRERVLEAYRRQCALCQFRHEEMLDAAHIVPDSEQDGEPRIFNGLALCSLHHAAYDRYFLGITPDYRIHIREDILSEKDGPTLRYGLQALHGAQIYLPRREEQRPKVEFLAMRFEKFMMAMRE